MDAWEAKAYKDYRRIVADPELLGGHLALRGTRLSVSLILECLANGMTEGKMEEAFGERITREVVFEVLSAASDVTNSFHVAA